MTDALPPTTIEPTAAWAPQVPPSSGTSGLVVAAGVILIVISGLAGLLGLFAILGAAIMDQMAGLYADSGLSEEQVDAMMALGRTFIYVFGGLAIVIGLAHLLSGIGVLRRRGWARILGLVLSVLGLLIWGLFLASSLLAATQALPAGYLEGSGLTVEEYRSLAGPGWIFSILFTATGLGAYIFILVVLIRRGREFA